MTNCFTSLKKAVNELQKAGVLTESLEMATTTVRRDTITLRSGENANENLFDFELDLHEPVRISLSSSLYLKSLRMFRSVLGRR